MLSTVMELPDENDLPDINQCSYELEEGELIDSILDNEEDKHCVKTENYRLTRVENVYLDKLATSDKIESTDGEITDSDNEVQMFNERFNKNSQTDYRYASGIIPLETKNTRDMSNDYYHTPGILHDEKHKYKEDLCKNFKPIKSDVSNGRKEAKISSKCVKPKQRKHSQVKSIVKKFSNNLESPFNPQINCPYEQGKDSLFSDSAKEGACSVKFDGENIIITRSLGNRLPQMKENNKPSRVSPMLELKDYETNVYKKDFCISPELDMSKELENSLLCSEDSGDECVTNSVGFKEATGIVSSTPNRLNTGSLKRWEPQFLHEKESFLVLDEFGEPSDQELTSVNSNESPLSNVTQSPIIAAQLSPNKLLSCAEAPVSTLPIKSNSDLDNTKLNNSVHDLEITISNENSANKVTVIENKNITVKRRSSLPNLFADEENSREIKSIILERPKSADCRYDGSISETIKEEQTSERVETLEMPVRTDSEKKIDIEVLPKIEIKQEIKLESEESKDNAKNIDKEHTTIPDPIVNKEPENIIVNQQGNVDKDTEQNVQKVVPKIEEDYVSNNPEENADNFNPEWELLRKLETDAERYTAMRKRWKNLVIPDPNQELTFQTWRMNNRSAPSTSATFSQSTSNACTDTDSIDQRKRSENIASSNHKRVHSEDPTTGRNEAPTAKRARTQSCTTIYDTKLKQLQDVEQVHLEYDRARHAVEERSSIKYRNLLEACDEVKAFHMFYRGLDPKSESGDTLYLSDVEIQELWNTEHLYEQYKQFYSN
ncbi:hypothetical protein C0J52_16732 [Blattella germanica]|nr:hypothetical protein C0J52_16732 [Blattella germanica]